MRVAGLGYIAGVELDAGIARMIRNGVSRDAAEDLMSACEQGFVAAMNRRENDDGNEPD